jgi:hypothetical protein
MKQAGKATLSGYKLVSPYLIGGFVIVATVIVGYVGWKSFFDKPKEENNIETPAATTPVNPLAQFDGTYTGTSNANAGITNATVSVVNGIISGTANYIGAYNTQVNLSVPGTVDVNGIVAGSLSGTGSAEGQSVAVGGSYNGTLVGTTMTVSYSGSGGGESASGTIVLTKK